MAIYWESVCTNKQLETDDCTVFISLRIPTQTLAIKLVA